jgi:protein SCO1/2
MKYICLIASLLLAGGAQAGAPNPDKPVLPKYLQGVGIDQNLNAQVPLGAQFTDESGRAVKLGDYLGTRPAVLALVYYTCPMLCDQILRGVVHGLRPLSLQPGRDFDIIAISINPKEGPLQAAAKRQEFVSLYSKHASPKGWHFLTGNDANIHAVADAVGFHYRYDAKTGMFFHAAAIMVLTPKGRAARYFYGVEFQPKDLKLGLIEASGNRIGSPVDQLLLFCCHYDPLTAKYTSTVLDLLHVSAALFLILLVAGLLFFWRHDIRNRQHPHPEVQRT